MLIKDKIFIGYDAREQEAYNTCTNSIKRNTSLPLDISPLKMDNLREAGIYKRDIDPLSSTEFSFTRFLIPYLCNYKGWALFCDCDFVFLDDIQNLLSLKNEEFAVMCVQHDYTPQNQFKMDGKEQHIYPRKNWSSLVLWNCEHPSNRAVTPELVNTQSGQFLHRFTWLEDKEIGKIPLQWNWLVGWYKEPLNGKPKALHFTEGGPWFDKYKNCEYSDIYNLYK